MPVPGPVRHGVLQCLCGPSYTTQLLETPSTAAILNLRLADGFYVAQKELVLNKTKIEHFITKIIKYKKTILDSRCVL